MGSQPTARGWAYALMALLLAAGCSCGEKATTNGDLGLDARVDQGQDAGSADLAKADLVKADLYPASGCGGSRTLVPEVVPPKSAKACGPGCKQISWGNYVRKSLKRWPTSTRS